LQYRAPSLATLQHAAIVYTSACESALARLLLGIPL
jgi:hypothetical protein